MEGRLKALNKTKHKLYQACDFARLAGVTVRTLHHYDRLGLLKPNGYTASGYRLYGEQAFARLQQIVTLKFIGLSLKQIKILLAQHELDLPATLRLQRKLIEQQRVHLDAVLAVIERAERISASGVELDWAAFNGINEVINMQEDMSWTDEFYSDEARAALAEKRRTISPEEVTRVQREWAELLPEVEAAAKKGVDPTSEQAKQLAARWRTLVEAFTGGNKAIQEGLNRMHANKANFPVSMPRPYSDAAADFIQRAMTAR